VNRTSFFFTFQLFPPHVIKAAERYRFDKELKDDPVEYQRIYEEFKIEAALVVIVRISISRLPVLNPIGILLELPIRRGPCCG